MFFYKLQQLLYGRHGNDNLNNFILASMVACAVINIFFRSSIIYFVQLALFALWIFRLLSKNFEARNRENEKYLAIKSQFVSNRQSGYSSYDYTKKNYQAKSNTKTDKNFKYFKCPNCASKLRVPKNKGKITITCPKCRTSFKGKS